MVKFDIRKAELQPPLQKEETQGQTEFLAGVFFHLRNMNNAIIENVARGPSGLRVGYSQIPAQVNRSVWRNVNNLARSTKLSPNAPCQLGLESRLGTAGPQLSSETG